MNDFNKPNQIQSQDIQSLRKAVLRLEVEIIALLRCPNFNEKEVLNKRIILKYYRKMIRVYEAKNGGLNALT